MLLFSQLRYVIPPARNNNEINCVLFFFHSKHLVSQNTLQSQLAKRFLHCHNVTQSPHYSGRYLSSLQQTDC